MYCKCPDLPRARLQDRRRVYSEPVVARRSLQHGMHVQLTVSDVERTLVADKGGCGGKKAGVTASLSTRRDARWCSGHSALNLQDAGRRQGSSGAQTSGKGAAAAGHSPHDDTPIRHRPTTLRVPCALSREREREKA